ncbi:FAD/NAD-binding domain-containing protein [Lentinula edodes]|uniref:FAD/NAD-binding domain-containing protein n=1 Tax=Lentinula edodes TaxID=5353 RepID=UPI001E8ED9B1|nr:FAD/NAD-binding domain-containing protein [Lentinula edodes]KAH7872221.1 FAD/NAD-binding domain-containing protein [Lentinula edodes]
MDSQMHTTVLVIGGGPGGSYASTLLAREGINVALLEAAKHPRHLTLAGREHVGESMLPSMRHYLRFIDLEHEYDRRGFPGAAFKFVQGERECYTDFNILGPDRTTWNVLRAEADEIMLQHAASQGVLVFEETRVNEVYFQPMEAHSSRPVSATWTHKSGRTGKITFDWLIDASGREGILSTKYLRNRIFREGLCNVALYGYWKNVTAFNEGGPRSNAPWFECLTDKLGWAWLIPLHNGMTSIGVVMHEETSKSKRLGQLNSLKNHYFQQLKLAPGVQALIGTKGYFVNGSIKMTSDYSYHATSYSGDHYRIIGDAAAFVDPLFSSGVHSAMTGALSAVSTILGSMKGQVTELEAQAWHDAKVGVCQTRFLLIVLSAYKQMQHGGGNRAIVGDINHSHFETAFNLFRPVYQGESDTTSTLTDSQLSTLIDFTRNLFTPTSHEQYNEVHRRNAELTLLSGPVMGPDELDKVIEADDGDAKAVLRRINALKILRNDTSPESFTSEVLNGYVVRLERGQLGLVKV